MCAGIALDLSELPLELHGRVHVRNGQREVRFLWRHHPRLLPVWHEGRLRLVRWGGRRGGPLPPTARDQVEQLREDRWWAFRLRMSCLFGGLILLKVVLYSLEVRLVDDWNASELSRFVALVVLPYSLPLWQWATPLNSVIVFASYYFVVEPVYWRYRQNRFVSDAGGPLFPPDPLPRHRPARAVLHGRQRLDHHPPRAVHPNPGGRRVLARRRSQAPTMRCRGNASAGGSRGSLRNPGGAYWCPRHCRASSAVLPHNRGSSALLRGFPHANCGLAKWRKMP
jgi:hypothetical protein